MEEFNNLREKTKELKDKIEKEIEKINILFENVNNEVIKYFKDIHEILIKEENKLKEKLKKEVNKVKEKLEIFLSESNNQINIGDRIDKGIKSISNEKTKKINIWNYKNYLMNIIIRNKNYYYLSAKRAKD